MKCPNCSKTMEEGNVLAISQFYGWEGKDKKKIKIAPKEIKNNPFGMMFKMSYYSKLKGWLCQDCNLVTYNYSKFND